MKSENYQNFTILSFSQLASTNDTAFEMVANFQADHNYVITCDSQTQGKGRLGRNWQEGRDNLYFSLILQPKTDNRASSELVFVAINALYDAVYGLFVKQNIQQNVKIAKKWPNDLLINDKKVAGILLEGGVNQSQPYIVIGIGVNIATNPQNVMFKAANLQEFGLKINKNQLLLTFLDSFGSNFQSWQDFGFKIVKNKFLENAWHLNEQIAIDNEKAKVSGLFVDMDDDGAIIIKDQKSQRRRLLVGDIS